MAPPFHGERMHAFGQLMREIAERAVAAWPVGEPLSARADGQRRSSKQGVRRSSVPAGGRDG